MRYPSTVTGRRSARAVSIVPVMAPHVLPYVNEPTVGLGSIGVWEQFLRLMVGDDWYEWDDTVMTVLRMVNRDQCAWYETLIGIECFVSKVNVQRILTAYMNYVKTNKLEGWRWTIRPSVVGGAIQAAAIGAAQSIAGWAPGDPGIVTATAAAAGVPDEVAWVVLNWLYTLSMRGELTSVRFLRPHVWDMTASDRIAQPEFQKPGGIAGMVVNTAGRAVDGLGEVVDAALSTVTVLARILPFAAIGLGAYLLYDLYTRKIQ